MSSTGHLHKAKDIPVTDCGIFSWPEAVLRIQMLLDIRTMKTKSVVAAMEVPFGSPCKRTPVAFSGIVPGVHHGTHTWAHFCHPFLAKD